MPKCREWPETARALNKYLSSGFEGANVNAMWVEIDLDPDRYGGRVSRNTIENFRKTGMAMAKTEQVVRTFLTKSSGFEPETPIGVELYQKRDEFAVRPRTMPTNASTAGVVRSATQARATVEPGASRSGR